MEYHVMLGPFADYTEASIQYGYATMFVSAYPLAAIMSFVNNYIGADSVGRRAGEWNVMLYALSCQHSAVVDV
jgi:hypothetical protein